MFNKLPNAFGRQGNYSEEEEESGYDEFALRTYDPTIGRWLSTDRYDELASPYLGMGNDPVNNVDPDGGSIGDIIAKLLGGFSQSAPVVAGRVSPSSGSAAAGTSAGSVAGAAANAGGNAVAGYLGGKVAAALFPTPSGPDASQMRWLGSVGPKSLQNIGQPREQQVISSYNPSAPVSKATTDARRDYAIEQHLKAERQSSLVYKVLDNASLTVQMIPGVKQMLGNERAVHLEGEEATTNESIWGMAETAEIFIPLGPGGEAISVIGDGEVAITEDIVRVRHHTSPKGLKGIK